MMVLQGWSARATTPIDMNTPHDTGENAPSSTTDQRPPSVITLGDTSRDSSESPTIVTVVVKKNIDWKRRAMIVDDPKVAGRDHPIIIHVGWNVLRGRACVHSSRCWPAQLLFCVSPFLLDLTAYTPARPQAMRYLVQSGHAKHPPGMGGRLEKLKLATVTLVAALKSNPDFSIGISSSPLPQRCDVVPITPRHFHLGRVLSPPLPSAMGRAHSELRRCGHRAAGWDRMGAFCFHSFLLTKHGSPLHLARSCQSTIFSRRR